MSPEHQLPDVTDRTRRISKGKLGYRSEIRGVIAAGDRAGDTIIARTQAGLFTFRCRITAQLPEAAGPAPSAVSDEQLLAEVVATER